MSKNADMQQVTQLCGHAALCNRWDPPRRAWLKAHNCQDCENALAARLATLRADGEACYLRYGALPVSGRSRNGATGGAEAGVSAYPAYRVGGTYYMDLTDCGFSAMWLANRDVYVVTGTLMDERGSDGEPLLSGATARKLGAGAIIEWVH